MRDVSSDATFRMDYGGLTRPPDGAGMTYELAHRSADGSVQNVPSPGAFLTRFRAHPRPGHGVGMPSDSADQLPVFRSLSVSLAIVLHDDHGEHPKNCETEEARKRHREDDPAVGHWGRA